MYKYVIKRVLIAIGTVFALATITFFLMKIIPGDPFNNPKVPEQVREAQRAYYGLDKPVIEQYLNYIWNLLHGDLGSSMVKRGRTVTSIIAQTFPISAKLGLLSLLVVEVIGDLCGIICARTRGRLADRILLLFSVIGVAMPSMVIGPILRYIFGVQLEWLPVTGWGTAAQLILPVIVLGYGDIAGNIRGLRASMLRVSTEDYIKTAQAKGLNTVEVVWHHQLRNAFVPIISNLGVAVASVMMGSFVVENMFLIPGLGKYFVDSVTTMDYPMIMGLTIFYGTFLVTMNLLIDVVYGLLDPQIRIK